MTNNDINKNKMVLKYSVIAIAFGLVGTAFSWYYSRRRGKK